jgi:galactoside O-acetyltransferase
MQMQSKLLSWRKRKVSPYLDVQPSALIDQCHVEVRRPVPDKKFMTVGPECVVSGRFVFETENGQIIIGNDTFIGGGLFVCVDRITIGSGVLISWGCTVIDNDAHSLHWDIRKNDVRDWKRGMEEKALGKYKNWEHIAHAPIAISDKVWIGFNSIILKGITIGEGAVIGAGSVVTSDIPPYAVAAGNPAKVIRML